VESRDQITQLLKAAGEGDREAFNRLFPLVYRELRRQAGAMMNGERPDHTLQPTAVVSEVYLRLVRENGAQWANRVQFYAVAAMVMRRILVDHAKRRNRKKRGGGWKRVAFDDLIARAIDRRDVDVRAVDEALNRLAEICPQRARVVVLTFFGGMTQVEIAEYLGVAERTVQRHWRSAKAWLGSELSHA